MSISPPPNGGISVRSSIDAELVKGVITLQKDSREVKFTPIERMTSGAYVLTVIGIEDIADNVLLTPVSIFFGAVEIDTTQSPVDVIPPQVVSTTPAEGQSVKSTGSLVMRFSEEVDTASARAGIVVSGVEGGVDVSGAVVIFKPREPMTNGVHTLVVVGVKDLAGNVMASSVILPFEVIAPPTEELPPPLTGQLPNGEGNVIYANVGDFIVRDSQFGVQVQGNKWIKVADRDGFDGIAYGAPGDNDRDVANPPGVPFLVIKLPQQVPAGESTANGKTWIPWARMRVPTDFNSFFWQTSTDKRNWKPQDNTNQNRWNDDSKNGSNAWYWQDNLTGNDGAISADIAIGVNYIRIGVRESNPQNFPLIDVVCLRNDGEKPSDVEAVRFLAGIRPVQSSGKLSTLWVQIKTSFQY